MPRKRTTRAVNTRAKPKLTDTEEIVNGMTVAERKAKLDNLLKDLDLNTENILRRYDEEQDSLEKMIEKQFYQIRCKLSPMELQMTVEDYIEFTQSQNEEEDSKAVSEPRTKMMPAVSSSLLCSKSALSKYSSLRGQRPIDTILEEGEASAQKPAPKKQRKKRGATNKGNGVTFGAEPLSTVQDSYVTPAFQRNLAATGWGATPLITPKFDPRLPITPAVTRRLKPGEVGVSLAGSPLSMVQTIVHNGKEIEVEIPDGADIKSLMSTLRNIIKQGEGS